MPSKAIAFAATLNVSSKNEIIVWYLKDGYSLMKLRPINALLDNYKETIVTKSAPIVGVSTDNKEVPSQVPPFQDSWTFAQATTTKMKYAFAVRDDHKVCMISPAYYPLPNTTPTNYSVAACGTTVKGSEGPRDSVLLFYLKAEGNNDPELIEYDMEVPWQKPLPDAHPDSKKYIYEYNTFKRRGEERLPIEDALATTPLAACLYNKTVYYFWLSGGYVLMYITCVNGKWSSPASVPPNEDDNQAPNKADSQSDLAAVADPSNKCIVLYYKADGSPSDYDEFVWKNLE
ncbi:hypothetical protein EYZ11_010523 [Aspergillus tanneri]|uniref:Fucose-specific lectin n=1 Tax=Aspergillus tanneri TaxID=1220188 RepID=A0A4S3JAJ1_9EURO|nr:uncharacterized protein ATNIH1004_001849 [Aspergillus tanneri]KAA8641384.1 hypothetical protein ATNIH1004_001849 [Aspergillus tanneri]THC90021.1 hypothetical protein EYZ11_010523 [Aspergillus tanneri]